MPIFEEATGDIKQVKASLFSPETGIATTDLRQAINIDNNNNDDNGDNNKAIRNTFPNNLYIQPKALDHLLSLNYNNKFDGGDGGSGRILNSNVLFQRQQNENFQK